MTATSLKLKLTAPLLSAAVSLFSLARPWAGVAILLVFYIGLLAAFSILAQRSS